MFSVIFKNKVSYFIITLYLAILVWWIKLQVTGLRQDEAYLFDWAYGFIGLIGSLYCVFYISKVWGGFKSVIGRGLLYISLGLLGQWFGLQIWTYYNVLAKVEVPYPSLADVGYFALVPFYTLGALMFAKAAGGKFSLRTINGKIIAILIPLFMLCVSYFLFVRDIGFDISLPIKTFFDFGYPLGELIPVSIAMFTFTLSGTLLGGKMKSRVLYLVFAFIFQFITEYAFLYAAGKEMYYNGGFNDLLYFTSYTIMILGLISFKKIE